MDHASKILNDIKFGDSFDPEKPTSEQQIESLNTFARVCLIEAINCCTDEDVFPTIAVERTDEEGIKLKSKEIDYSKVFGMTANEFFRLLVDKGCFQRTFIQNLKDKGF